MPLPALSSLQGSWGCRFGAPSLALAPPITSFSKTQEHTGHCFPEPLLCLL